MDFNKFKLPLVLAIFGFLLSSRRWILFMNSLSPLVGLLVYYTILIITVIILEKIGLTVAGISFNSFQQAIGTILIIFSFFICVNFTSCYINDITIGSCNPSEISNIYLQSEDGATFYLWSKLFPNNIQACRILTFVVTPFVLSLIGCYLIKKPVAISPF